MFKLKNQHLKNSALIVISLLVLIFELKPFFVPKTSIQTPRYLMANRPLQAGDSILAMDFSLITNPSTLPTMPVTDQQVHFLKNSRLLSELKENEILSFEKIALSSEVIGYGKNTPKGYSAYAIHYDNALAIKTGEKVDIYATKTNGSSLLIIQKVIALEGSKANNQIVLALSSYDIQIYEQARQSSKITLAIQNPNTFKKNNLPKNSKVILWEN